MLDAATTGASSPKDAFIEVSPPQMLPDSPHVTNLPVPVMQDSQEVEELVSWRCVSEAKVNDLLTNAEKALSLTPFECAAEGVQEDNGYIHL
jgi:hypothetical protein